MKIETSRRLQSMKSSIFTDLLDEKKEYENTHKQKVIDLSLGSPSVPISETIVETMVRSVSIQDNYRYAVTILPDMVEAIQKWYLDRYQVKLEKDELLLLQGSQEALINLPLVFCNPEDGVLIQNPYYPAYHDAPALAEAEVLYMPLKEENDYLINFDDISAEARKKAKMMIVCYPNNPTGAVAPDSFFEKMISFARENDIIIVYDNAYSELIYEGEKGRSFLSFPGAFETGVEINSFSKTYGMAGARLGVLVGNSKIIHAYQTLKSNMDYGVFLPVQYAGIEALRSGEPLIRHTRELYQNRRDLLVDSFRKAGWKLPKSRATLFIWAPIPEKYENCMKFARDLLQRTGILVTPGTAFGSEGEGYIRIALSADDNGILEAARRLQETHFFQ